MKLLLVGALFGAAAAFAPSARPRTSTSLQAFSFGGPKKNKTAKTVAKTSKAVKKAAAPAKKTATKAAKKVQKSVSQMGNTKGSYSDELGAIAPLGFWDPLNFCTSDEKFYRYRCVELKHGRVAMAAVAGYLIQENARFGGYLSPSADLKFADVPNGLAAINAVPALGWLQVFIAASFFELGLWKQDPNMPPGDYGAGYGVLGKIKDPAVREQKLNIELSNGRLAMIAIMALMVQDKLNGSPYYF